MMASHNELLEIYKGLGTVEHWILMTQEKRSNIKKAFHTLQDVRGNLWDLIKRSKEAQDGNRTEG